MSPRRVVAALVVATTLAGTAACSGSAPAGAARAGVATAGVAPAAAATPAGSADPDAPVLSALGVRVRGGFGSRPAVEIPAGTTAPSSRRVEVLSRGTGPQVAAGDLVVTGYRVQSWAGPGTPSATLEDTWARGVPAIGVAGPATPQAPWGDVVVGRRVGARLLVVQPAQADRPATAVVLDLVRVVDRTGPSGRTVRGRSAKGFPQVAGAPGTKPEVTGLDAVGRVSAPRSRLLVAGEGRDLDPDRTFVVHLVEVDLPSGRIVNSTWGGVPLLLPASGVLDRVSALEGARAGSRAVAVLPGSGAVRARILVVDVVGQV